MVWLVVWMEGWAMFRVLGAGRVVPVISVVDLSKCNSAETSCALQIWRCTPEMETLSGKHMNNPYGHTDILYGSM